MAYNTDWGSRIDAAFKSKGLPTGSGAALMGVENASGSLTAASGTGAVGLLQQTKGFMNQWNPGGSLANPDDQITAASNFYSYYQGQGYTPDQAYVIYQQGPGGANTLFNTDPNTPISALDPTLQKNLINNGVDPNGTVGDAVDHIEGQYQTGAGYAKNAGLDTSGVPTANGAAPGKGGAQAKKAGQLGTSFGGAGCAAAGLTPAGAMAAAAVASGAGMGANSLMTQMAQAVGSSAITGAAAAALSGGGNIFNAALNGATGALSSGFSNLIGGAAQIAGNALNSISGGAFQALSQMGANILPSLTGVLPGGINGLLQSAIIGGLRGGVGGMISGALNNVVSGTVGNMLGPMNGVLYQSPYPNAIQQFGASGGLNGMIQQVSQNIVSGRGGRINGFVNNIGLASALSSVANNVIGATAEASALQFGPGINGLGANYRNNNDIVSYGVTALSRNLPGASSDLLNLGTFKTTQPLRLQQPSHVANQIIQAGLGTKTGLTRKLVNENIPIAGLDNPIHDNKVKNILDSINDPNATGAVSSAFNIRKPISNLGQLTDFNYMCPTLAQTSPSTNFSDLGQHFLSLGITKAKTFQEVGSALSKVDAGLDLQYLSQHNKPITQQATDTLMQTYGYGGGTIGEITMADFIGTAAGYVHNDTLAYILDANSKIAALPEGQELARRLSILNTLINGGYYAPGHDGSGSGGGSAISSAIFVPEFGKTYTTLDAAVLDCIDLIEAQLTVIKNINDPEIQAVLQAAEIAHAASCAQILKENHYIQTFGMDLFENSTNTPLTAYVFASSLPSYGLDNGYGKIGDFIERVASDNIYGDSIKACLRMGKNASILRDLGINTDRFALPHSKYYRQPLDFYLDAYTGQLPTVPDLLMDHVIPETNADMYIELRNQKLIENGYNPLDMLPAQADETYYDLMWTDTSHDIKENIGLNVVQQAIDRNIMVIGNKMFVIGLNRRQIQFATIETKGLSLTNNEIFVATLLSIVNKMLYGEIGTTKYDNPFFTDQMIYGILELLGQVTPNNISALQNTLLGGIVLTGLMEKIRLVFETSYNKTNTSMDRNATTGWGAAGPDGDTIIPPRKL